jgi:hypothetical protein
LHRGHNLFIVFGVAKALLSISVKKELASFDVYSKNPDERMSRTELSATYQHGEIGL